MKLNSVHQLLQQEVSRKEFLRYLGLSLLALVGITGFIKSLDSSLNTKPTGGTNKASGYGMNAYGR